jgi:hypothetical protein
VGNSCRSDDRRRHAGTGEQPCERYLCAWYASVRSDRLRPVDDIEVAVRDLVLVVGGAHRETFAVAGAGAGKPPARERAPRQHGHTLVDALRDHLALFLAVDEVVVVLHRGEPRGPVAVGRGLSFGELPREHAARPEVACLSHLDDVMERVHRLRDRRCRIPAMDLVEVDIVHPEPLQRGVDRCHHVLA